MNDTCNHPIEEAHALKLDLIAWLLTLPPESYHREAVEQVRKGEISDDELLRLSDLAKELNLSSTWLCRLGVPNRLGIQFAGSRRYRPHEVQAWLQSEECSERVSELHRQRKEREAAKEKE
jgi:hypothetical protein